MITSKITTKSQTTIPRGVREALEIEPGDEIAYDIHAGFAIVRAARDVVDDDPALGPFLAFLANDMRGRPDALRPISNALLQRIRSMLDTDLKVDPEEAIEGEVAI